MALSIFSLPALADSSDTYSPNYLVTIEDANGNIVYQQALARSTYVDGTEYTIPAGGSITTYQYEPSVSFSTGFLISQSTSGRSVTVAIYNSASIGGTRSLVKSSTVNTSMVSPTTGPDSDHYMVSTTSISSSKPYYNGKITNNSSSSMTLALCVSMD